MSFEVRNLVKSYGEKTVVNGLSFKMDGPGVYALLGTNGAGKTTSIRMILGMLKRDSGEVLWNGAEMQPEKMNIGYLAEERGLYPKYTLLDQLLYFAKLKGVGRAKAMEKIKYWSARLQLDEYIFPAKFAEEEEAKEAKKRQEREGEFAAAPAPKSSKAAKAAALRKKRNSKSMRAEQLSKGNQQKVQLMAALLSDPEFVILDEPMSGLDPVNTDLFKEVIRDEISKDKYVIMSSHQMPTIEEFCTDIIIMNRGNVVLQGNLNEIKKSYGRVNLFVKCEQPIDALIKQAGLTVIEETPAETQIRVTGEEQAMEFLQLLLANRITVIKFDLREPSLHEIFVEKVGAGNEE